MQYVLDYQVSVQLSPQGFPASAGPSGPESHPVLIQLRAKDLKRVSIKIYH